MGFTNGTKYTGCKYDEGNGAIFRNTSYGALVGQTAQGTANSFKNGDTVGVTTDPTKSGIAACAENMVLPSVKLGKFLIRY